MVTCRKTTSIKIWVYVLAQLFWLSQGFSRTNSSLYFMDAKNVLGTALKMCCSSPMTGFYRDGFCKTGPYDYGKHLVCAQVTAQFLEYSKSKGNDLTKSAPEYGFPGLSPGDKWCLCAMRWLEAYQAGLAPKIDLQASHEKLLEFISLDELQKYEIAHPH